MEIPVGVLVIQNDNAGAVIISKELWLLENLVSVSAGHCG
jgi:hypothetical protein